MVAAADALGTDIPSKRATDNDAVAIDLAKFMRRSLPKVREILAQQRLTQLVGAVTRAAISFACR
jgi:hypothetical protein